MFVRHSPILQRGWGMSFSRGVTPAATVTGELLTSYMAGIGMNFAAPPLRDANIEDTLLFASIEGVKKDDLRVAAVLVTWFGVHASRVNADRLTRLITGQRSPGLRALWSALAQGQSKDRRFARLAGLYVGPRIDLVDVGTDFQVARHGEDARFKGTPVRVASNVLRERAGDILSPTELAKRHHPYRCRVIMGPSYRADMWASLEEDPTLSIAALARKAYGSFATAWHVRRDFELVGQGKR
jgi:hypothetical protein